MSLFIRRSMSGWVELRLFYARIYWSAFLHRVILTGRWSRRRLLRRQDCVPDAAPAPTPINREWAAVGAVSSAVVNGSVPHLESFSLLLVTARRGNPVDAAAWRDWPACADVFGIEERGRPARHVWRPRRKYLRAPIHPAGRRMMRPGRSRSPFPLGQSRILNNLHSCRAAAGQAVLVRRAATFISRN